jgi:hypothetical protein
MFPGTSAVLSESGKDLRDHFDKGRYGSMIGDGIKQLATLPVALADDVIGGFGRGAYRTLRDPVEDAGRAALGLEDRKEPAVAAAAPPAQPEVLTPPPTTMPAPQPEQPALRQGPTEADMAAQRRVDRDAQTLRDTALGDSMEASRLAREAAGYAAQAQPQHLGKQWADDKDAWNASVKSTVGGDGLSARQRRQFNIQDQQVAATLRGQDLSADTSLRTNENTNRTTLRGQDMDYQGKRAEVAGASARAQQEQLNKDRTYQLDVARFGVETANKNRDDARAGEKAFSDRISGLVGDDKDGVKASRVRVAANMFIGDSIRAAEAELRANPGNAKAARDLERLKGGPGALDDKMLSELLLSTQAQEAATEYDGMMPWSGKAKNTTAPIKSLTEKKGVIWDDYVTDSGSGNQVIPKRALRDRPDLQRLVTP